MTKTRFLPLVALFFSLFLGAVAQSCLAASSVDDDPVVEDVASQDGKTENFSLHGQATYVLQYKNQFNSPYEGTKSMLSTGDQGKSYTLTMTPFMGARLWEGAAVFYNPEAVESMAFSNLSGLGGFTNGEMQRGSNVPMKFYNARYFIQQTFSFGGGQAYVESGPNQLAGYVDTRRLRITYGGFSALDYFDNNKYSHDPRTQFLNWSFMTMGAWDFPANARGYTYGVVAEYFDEGWAVRLGRLAMPKEPNSLRLDWGLNQQYGDQIEFEHEHTIGGQPGALRFLLFQNRGWMASYSTAMSLAPADTPPDILTSRNSYQSKRGYGINLEQAITDKVGLFARWSWNDGQTETQAFTDIDRSLSGGVVVNGAHWGRPNDTWGVAGALNGIAGSQIAYLSNGGSTMFIGDGKLNYRKEQILETYYSFNVCKGAYLSADYQYIANPAYNADRGPVSFFGLRAHIEL
jgi:hypothetical protein